MNEDDFVPLSYLAQYGYCPRRASLLLVEQVWSENQYTAEGRAGHERVHDCRIEKRGAQVKLLDHAVWSKALGLSGKCDCIECRETVDGSLLPFLGKKYVLYPIEYKHGVQRDEREYQLQLCGQAMCLETMYGGHIAAGAVYYIQAHRRAEVELTNELRAEVSRTAEALQQLLQTMKLIPQDYGPRCKKCSIQEICMPRTKQSADGYCKALLQELCEGGIGNQTTP